MKIQVAKHIETLKININTEMHSEFIADFGKNSPLYQEIFF
jgi:hypothetical protein